MNSMIAVAVFFTVFSLAFCWLFFRASGYFWAKVASVAVFVLLCTHLAFSFDSYLGYPTKESWPDGAQLVGVLIRSPIPNTDDKGAIYLWVKADKLDKPWYNFFGYTNDDYAPRSYAIKFNKDNESNMTKAKRALQQNMTVKLKRKGKQEGEEGDFDPDAEGADGKQGKGGKGKGAKGTHGTNSSDQGYQDDFETPEIEITNPHAAPDKPMGPD